MSDTLSLKNLESYLQSLTRFGIRPGLDRINALLQSAQLTQLTFPCILVGGTNGKGSTCDFLARSLAADGLKTGLFTSPHLYHYNERIRILPANDNQLLFEGAISDTASSALLDAAMPTLQEVSQKMQDPTEFETLTLLSLLHFTRQQVEAAVLEVGLGGRWDCTNATDPLVSVLTHVELDHCDRLGDTREEIALDKVQIARPGRILVSAETRPEVLKVLSGYCQEKKVLFRPWRAPQYHTDPAWKAPTQAVEDRDFQTINRQTAMQARLAFYESIHQSAPPQEAKVLLPAVPGRFEIIRKNPMLIVDGANNPDGARHLVSRLEEELLHQPNRKVLFVLGILEDKDYVQMIEIFAPLASAVIATQSPSPRSAPAEDIAAKVSTLGIPVHTIRPVTAAVQKALNIATPDDIVVLTGSFYTLGELDRNNVSA